MDFRINGTDAGTIMGCNRYSNPYELWLIKTGRKDKPEFVWEESVQWGIRLEEAILDHVCNAELSGLQPKDSYRQVWLQNDAFGFPMTGYADYFDGSNLIEIKTANSFALAEWESGVPMNYYWQVIHYLIASGLQRGFIACLVGGQKLITHWVELKPDDAEMLIAAEREFYHCLINDTEPPMLDVVPEPETCTMDIDVERLCQMYQAINAKISELEKEKKLLAANVKELVGNNKTQEGNIYKASYKYYPQTKFDDKALAEAEPEIYAKYVKESGFYRLDIKEIKK